MKLLMVGCVAFILVLTFAAFSPLSGAGEKADTFEKRFALDTSKPVVIDYTGVDEDVIIEKHGGDDILFKFDKEFKGSSKNKEYFEGIEPILKFEDNTLHVEIKYPKRKFNLIGLFSISRLKVVSRLYVPHETNLNVRVVDGDVQTGSVEGAIQLKTVDGDLKLEDCSGSIELISVDGDIEVKDGEGSLDAVTVDGDIKAAGVFNGFKLESVDGDCNLVLEKGSRLTEDCKLKTVDGDLRVKVPGDFLFAVDFKSKDGEFRSNALEFNKVSSVKKHRFQGERKGAEYTIYAKTVDGDCDIKEL